ncbi:type II toxin-antitoxin system HipA family toxin [Shewanella livingstonensis]|uniref:Type II toxin-antitoxin system HipA family toxin n=1 Tax=Shewanella livingstonensis TaxID=150120 RepID=A0A3G8LYN7_9GAMM|nr:type II toxin-antitoxin system HipA family toxin [Shewanella livingstonensis]AZG74796.1 type II toxin-antitoxin system HipA family toxin [Shewanella livingstonensis]
MQNTLPNKITSISVSAAGTETGLLTYGSIYNYQPVQSKQHISLTMTQNGMDGFSSGALHPIFTQNLPEGFNRRYIAEKLARYAKVNDMYLLALQGDHGIGMLSYQSELTLPEAETVTLNDILTYKDVKPLFPQLLEKYYLRNSLAGVQPKVSIPTSAQSIVGRSVEQKDLIVKSFDPEFPLLTVNEFVCMSAARHCGLNPPNIYLSENLESFVIERFDKGDSEQKLGYEDFTTLLRKNNDPDAKYNGSYETLLKATMLYTNSQDELEKMYKYIVFNCLIGNGDAHLKNFSLQYTADMSKVFVSPPFDITHTLIYHSIDNKMALKMANSKAFPDLQVLLKLAENTSYRVRQPKQIIESMSDLIGDYVKASDEAKLFPGLRESIDTAVSKILCKNYNPKGYRHDRIKKFD